MAFHDYSSPHLGPQDSVAVMVRHVLLALAPGIACAAWVFGSGILVNCLLASLTAVAAEPACSPCAGARQARR